MLSTASDVDGSLFARPAGGESVAQRAWPSAFTVFDPASRRANFFYLHDVFLMMDERTANLCGKALGRSGEVIRFDVEQVGSVYLFNPWATLEHEAVQWSDTKGRLGVYSNLTLRKELIPRISLFRLPKISGLYVSSDLQDDEDDFVYLYRKHRLSGLYFKELWDERSGGVPNRSTARGSDC